MRGAAHPGWAVLLAVLACGCSALPEGLAGEIATEDGRAGVPCRLRLWRGAIGPLDGRGDPLAEARVESGRPFEVALAPTGARDAGAGLLWISVECEGHFVKVRAAEWSGARRLLPALDLGRVFVPRAAPAAPAQPAAPPSRRSKRGSRRSASRSGSMRARAATNRRSR